MSFAPVAFAIASAVIPAVAGFSDAQYQRAVAKNNAEIAGANAQRAADRMQIEQQRSDREAAGELATAEALQSASGISTLSRSSLGARKRIYDTGREQAKDIIDAGTQESRNFLQEQANFTGEASAQNTKAWFSLAEGLVKGGSAVSKSSSSNSGGNSSLIGGSKSTKKGFK